MTRNPFAWLLRRFRSIIIVRASHKAQREADKRRFDGKA